MELWADASNTGVLAGAAVDPGGFLSHFAASLCFPAAAPPHIPPVFGRQAELIGLRQEP